MKNIRNSLLAVVLASLVAAPAFAGGPLYLNPGDPDGVERWPAGGANIPFNPDGVPAGGPGALALGPLDWATSVATLTASAAAWQAVPSATNTYSNNGPMPFDIDVTNYGPFIQNLFFGTNVSDGFSPIVLDQDGSIFVDLFGASGVLGFASVDTRAPDGTPIEAVMFLNGGAIFGGFPLADFEGVIVHEFGHYTGLAHTVTNGESVFFGDESGPTPLDTYGPSPLDQVETMYPFAGVGVAQFAVSPHADDVGMLSFLYPEPGFFDATGTFTGTIYAPNSVTPITGVNVIARNVADPFVDAVSAISGDRGVTGEYTLNGLTPGADYTVHVDEILAGGFSTPPIALPGPEEFHNGADESNNITSPDDPAVATLVSAGAGGTASGVDVIFNAPGPGDPLPVGDDGFVELFLPFTYSICGQDYDSVFVNANGSLTFGAGSTDFTESTTEFLAGPPRIAGVWDDLNPSAGGTVSFDQTPNTFTVSYDDVPEWFETGSNSFDITLHRASNNVDLEYGGVSVADGLAGISCGGANTSGFETEDDLTALQEAANLAADDGVGRINTKPQPARFEIFSGSDNDLDGETLLFNPTATYNDTWAENNDTPKFARKIKVPFDSIEVTRFTEIEPTGGDVDFYSFRLEGGRILSAEIISGQLDSMLVLADEDLNIIAFDDDGGAGLLSKIQAFVPATGRYYLGVSTFPDFGFTGAGGSGGRYVLTIDAIDEIVLDLGDDDFEEVPLGFDFPFNGSGYSSVFVNSNGNLTFGSGSTDFTESVSEFLNGQPRIAPLWDDLSPNNGGQVSVEYDSGEATVIFDAVPEFSNTGANTFMTTLRDDGTFTIEYGAVSAADGLAGSTEGGGAADPGETDLSGGGPFSAVGTTYEQFSGDNDLDSETLEFE